MGIPQAAVAWLNRLSFVSEWLFSLTFFKKIKTEECLVMSWKSCTFAVAKRIKSMKKKNKVKRYDLNKQAKVGTEIVCPVCGERFIKKSYQQAFCCTECKDRYWNQKRKGNGYFKAYNMAHPERLERLGIDIENGMYADLCLGDDECESLAQITLDPSCYDEVDW